ncbi:MAG: hypothetical protein KJO21_01520 [Verrucomicrobiae bacterium]|nr:hypothetical protein [Verrucomicrobiae bacterium]NNJ42214.1 hypothetical protein [Akkermansiaceae bacterium]
MSNQPIIFSEYIKQGIIVAIVIGLALFGFKSYRKHQQKRQVIIELSSHASESAAFEQFYQENARENLFKSMHQIHLGVKLGLTPQEVLDKVMRVDEALFSSDDLTELPIRKTLIRDALLSNFDNCVKLGLFSDASNIATLSKGEFPTIFKGPAIGEQAVIQFIIPSSVLPGVDKLLPNLIISPPTDPSNNASTRINNFEISRAKKLTKSLADAALIERAAHQQVVKFYNELTSTDPTLKPVR